MYKNFINKSKTKVVENMSKERLVNMNNNFINSLAGAIMSPVVDKMSQKVSVDEIRNLCNSLEFMMENELMQEAFSLLNIIIKSSGVRLPGEYRCIVDNAKLRADFVEEAITDLEDILYDLE